MLPDTTVLVNFAHVNMMPLLESLIAGRALWGATVAAECARSAEVEGLEVLREAIRFMGAPIRPETIQEYRETERIRIQLSRPGEGRHKNLGEAETLALIALRPSLNGVFVTDDKGALRVARAMGLRRYSTADLFLLAAKTNRCTVHDAWNFMMVLRGLARHLPRCPGSYDEFASKCAQPSVV